MTGPGTDGKLTETTATLLAEALQQGAGDHGSRFFSPEVLAAIKLRRRGDALQVYCSKRQRWLKAKPEEVVRQLFLRWVVDDLSYPLSRIAVEWPIQMGSDEERE